MGDLWGRIHQMAELSLVNSPKCQGHPKDGSLRKGAILKAGSPRGTGVIVGPGSPGSGARFTCAAGLPGAAKGEEDEFPGMGHTCEGLT